MSYYRGRSGTYLYTTYGNFAYDDFCSVVVFRCEHDGSLSVESTTTSNERAVLIEEVRKIEKHGIKHI